MKLKIMPGRVVVKKHEAKLKGTIMLPPSRKKLYEIGEVVAAGDLKAYGPDGKKSSNEVYQPGDLVLFQLPLTFANMLTYTIGKELHCFLHADDIVARLTTEIVSLEAFQITGRYLLLLPSIRNDSVILLPDNAEEAKQQSLHFSVKQIGKDVKADFTVGQEVFPDRGRINPLGLDQQELVFVDEAFIYGAAEVG